MNTKEYYDYLNKGGGSTKKYSNTFTEYGGRKYHSAKEAKYAEELDWRLKGKNIASWEAQVRLPIIINGEKICTYILDFLITYPDGTKEYIDVKGYKKGVAYQYFKIKSKLLKAIHNIEIKEV